MKCHYFIIKQPLVMGVCTLTDRELIHRIKDVLKLRPGEKIVLSDGAGSFGESEILGIEKDRLELEVKNVRTEEKKKEVILYCAIIKKDNFELVAQKAAEIGVTKIIPMLTDRTIKKDLNISRLEKIVLEAAEQAENCWVPEIGEIVDFARAVENAQGRKILFDKSGEPVPLFLRDNKKESAEERNVCLFIGPEGGWSERELKIVKENDLQILNLGKNILRAETAVAVGCWIFCNSGL